MKIYGEANLHGWYMEREGAGAGMCVIMRQGTSRSRCYVTTQGQECQKSRGIEGCLRMLDGGRNAQSPS